MSQKPAIALARPRHCRALEGRAFTLIELLTVIAVIGILAAILIPVVGRVRESARASNCRSNLREIGKQLLLFANDNRGKFPAGPFNVNSGYSNGNVGTQTSGAQARITGRAGVLAFSLYPYITRDVDTAKLGTNALTPVHPNFICPSLVPPGSLSPEQALSYTLSIFSFARTPTQTPNFDVRVFNHTEGANSGGLDESKYPLPFSRIWAVGDIDTEINPGFNKNIMSEKPTHGNKRNRVYLDGSVRSVPSAKSNLYPTETT